MATTVLFFKISMPIMIAPIAMQKMAHLEGTNPTVVVSVGLTTWSPPRIIAKYNCTGRDEKLNLTMGVDP
ncbi:unnamed protein product [Ilex paraguariensis]|uniref:Uncharacterized protein n=1 Tax=Ilex paraguariensis TaxID=185542 RepID=A0ABC8RZR6_9AQUA